MNDEIGIPVSEEVQEVLRREQEQAGGISLADFSTTTMVLLLGKTVIWYGNDGFQCSCQIFCDIGACRHLMALKILVPSFPSLNLVDLAEGFKKEEQGNA